MAVPKSRWSKARSRRHRSNWKLTIPNLNACPQCHTLKLSHRVCKACGYYDGKAVVAVDEAK